VTRINYADGLGRLHVLVDFLHNLKIQSALLLNILEISISFVVQASKVRRRPPQPTCFRQSMQAIGEKQEAS
jgi:hypothetical protein